MGTFSHILPFEVVQDPFNKWFYLINMDKYCEIGPFNDYASAVKYAKDVIHACA